jgi:hypothetical protein
LIRPSLNELKERLEAKRTPPPVQQHTPPPQQHHGPPPSFHGPKKMGPPEQTNAENFYYAKQVSMKTPMVVVLKDGEAVHGPLEWYDKHCLRVARPDLPAVMIYKQNIKYMYKDE